MSPSNPSRRSFLRQFSAGALTWAAVREEIFASQDPLPGVRGDDSSAPFARLREQYDLAPDLTYLNHASIGTMPRVVREAKRALEQLQESNPHRYMWGDAWERPREEVRELFANNLDCQPQELALNRGTTGGFNALAHGLPLGEGDEVLFSSLNHVGAAACWEHMAEVRGFTVRRFEHPWEALRADDVVELYRGELRDETRLLVLPHIDNMIGIRHPVADIARHARDAGVQFIAVDGAQSVGMLPLSLSSLGVDFYATSTHKWVQSPKGLGLLYVQEAALDEVRPMMVTWGKKKWSKTARKFEDYGSRDFPSILSLGEAGRFQEALGGEVEKERHMKQLWEHLKARTDATSGLRWRSPREWSEGASLVAVETPKIPSKDLVKTLAERGFNVRGFSKEGLDAMRISPAPLNSISDLDHWFDAVEAELPS